MSGLHAVQFEKNGMGDEKGRAVCVGSKRKASVAPWVRSAKSMYLPVRKEYFLKCMKMRPGAVLRRLCTVCQHD